MRFARLFLALCAAFAIFGLTPAPLAAQEVEIEVTKGVLDPLPIAVAPFTGPANGDIAQVVSADLERSGLFRPVDRSRFPAQDPAQQPVFDSWKSVGAQALVNGVVTQEPDGRLRVDFRLWNVGAGQYLVGQQFVASPDSWRRIAHKIADVVYERLTGEKGYFDSRVAFVAESGPKTNRRRVLALMDQDGANPQLIDTGAGQVFTPRFSSQSQEITYMSLTDSGAQVYLYNLENARREALGSYHGMVFAPRFSPDGSKVAFSVERGGNSDIYVMDLRNRSERRLTQDPAIDTSPSFSPDGSKIIFNSDRGGSPQLYVMNADGSASHRVSAGGGRYSTPVWSPRGDYIAFTKQTGSQFHIGVMRPDGTDERLLTTSYLDEGPTWSPNGQVLMFFREAPGSPARLWTVDLTGRVLRQVDYQGSASDPAWSPLLN
ncbi:MAG TPA: Tol-Pal system beta propeller repeat protein TolB [Caulobacteraceae bacterium]|nr:Tol-Pal system beta propeller repeat protein TolB [Caulobacteraceae bacterium]